MSRAFVVGIMGAGEEACDSDCDLAYRLGREIALRGWVLLCGGRHVGVMAAAVRGADTAGGLSVGMLPEDHRRDAAPGLSLAFPTGLGNMRNLVNIMASDVIVACGADPGTGTLSEMWLALKAGRPLLIARPNRALRTYLQSLTSPPTLAEHVDDICSWLHIQAQSLAGTRPFKSIRLIPDP